MTEQNQLLKDSIFNFFKENNIEIDSDIESAISQVFDEFEFISPDNDDVNIYMREDIDSFEDDLTMTNAYNIMINGMSSGVYQSTYTYIDNVEYVTNEKTDLTYNSEIIETLIDFNYKNKTKVINKDEWCVSVMETIQWGDGDYSRIPRLYIYCPFDEKQEEENK